MSKHKLKAARTTAESLCIEQGRVIHAQRAQIDRLEALATDAHVAAVGCPADSMTGILEAIQVLRRRIDEAAPALRRALDDAQLWNQQANQARYQRDEARAACARLHTEMEALTLRHSASERELRWWLTEGVRELVGARPGESSRDAVKRVVVERDRWRESAEAGWAQVADLVQQEEERTRDRDPPVQRCASKNHACANPATWQCPRCQRHFCDAEGAADGHSGCDDCWAVDQFSRLRPGVDAVRKNVNPKVCPKDDGEMLLFAAEIQESTASELAKHIEIEAVQRAVPGEGSLVTEEEARQLLAGESIDPAAAYDRLRIKVSAAGLGELPAQERLRGVLKEIGDACRLVHEGEHRAGDSIDWIAARVEGARAIVEAGGALTDVRDRLRWAIEEHIDQNAEVELMGENHMVTNSHCLAEGIVDLIEDSASPKADPGPLPDPGAAAAWAEFAATRSVPDPRSGGAQGGEVLHAPSHLDMVEKQRLREMYAPGEDRDSTEGGVP